MEDYLIESEYGIQDMVITDPDTRIEATSFDILRKLYYNQGYKNGNSWETEQDIYFQDVLLERSYAAVLRGDFETADIYLALNYWNKELMDNIIIKAEEAHLAKEYGLEIMLRRIPTYGKYDNFQCKGLYFVLWKKHIKLLEYILAKINPQNITTMDLYAARRQELGKYLCKKDPVRFYMDKVYFGGELLFESPIMRNYKEQEEFLLKREAKYTGLAIHKFSKKNINNIVITRIPKDVLRRILSMI